MNKTHYFIWKLLCFGHLVWPCVSIYTISLSLTLLSVAHSRAKDSAMNLEVSQIHLFSHLLQFENCFVLMKFSIKINLPFNQKGKNYTEEKWRFGVIAHPILD